MIEVVVGSFVSATEDADADDGKQHGENKEVTPEVPDEDLFFFSFLCRRGVAGSRFKV